MDVPKVNELRKEIESLKTDLPADHQQLLRALGKYFWGTLSTNINDTYVLEVEVLLNNMLLQADEWKWSEDLQDSILEAVGLVAHLSDNVKRRPGKPRSARYFKTAKRLGKILLRASRMS